jgi:hypothetical protein
MLLMKLKAPNQITRMVSPRKRGCTVYTGKKEMVKPMNAGACAHRMTLHTKLSRRATQCIRRMSWACGSPGACVHQTTCLISRLMPVTAMNE